MTSSITSSSSSPSMIAQLVVREDRIRSSPLTSRICKLMREFIATQNYMRQNSNIFHQGVGGLDDRRTMSSDSWYDQQERRDKNITRYIKQLKKEGGKPIEYFSDEEIRNVVDPYFSASLRFDREELGMEKIYTPFFIGESSDESLEKILSSLRENNKFKESKRKEQEKDPKSQSLDEIIASIDKIAFGNKKNQDL